MLALLLSACASVPDHAPPELLDHTERGLASFYAMGYQGRETASGERFDQLANTAAHRTLPFDTLVSVKNLENNRSVVVRINDRGPFVEGRIIDLSHSAFDRIGDPEAGLIEVEIEVVE